MIDPERAAKAFVGIWALEGTDISCDSCSRKAKYAVYRSGTDYYFCVSHTALTLELSAKRLRYRASVAAS